MDKKQPIFSDQYFYPVNAVSHISFRDITSLCTRMFHVSSSSIYAREDIC